MSPLAIALGKLMDTEFVQGIEARNDRRERLAALYRVRQYTDDQEPIEFI